MDKKLIQQTLRLLLLLLFLTGLLYPLGVTFIAQTLFAWQANGSLLFKGDKPIGSRYIGQHFDNPAYFWGRPSNTAGFPYNPMGPNQISFFTASPDYLKLLQARAIKYKDATANMRLVIPADLITSSASGLDAFISPEAALYQIPRIAHVRNCAQDRLHQLVHQHIQPRTLGLLGEPAVNVLALNLALDKELKNG